MTKNETIISNLQDTLERIKKVCATIGRNPEETPTSHKNSTC